MYINANFRLPKSNHFLIDLLNFFGNETVVNQYHISKIETMDNHVLVNLRISLNYRNEVKQYLNIRTVVSSNKGELEDISLMLPGVISHEIRVNNINLCIGQEFPVTVPYLCHWMIPHIKPWQTFNEFLVTLSKEWQLDVFGRIVCNMVYADCESIVDADYEDKRDEFVNCVDSDFRGFVRNVIDNDWVDLEQVYEYAKMRVNAGLYLNSLNRKDSK